MEKQQNAMQLHKSSNIRCSKLKMNSNSERDECISRIPRQILASPLYSERPITVDEACGIRLLLFGDTAISFGNGWALQGFKFRTHPTYGIRQKRPGPCGVLAAVQSHVIYELLFGYSRTMLNDELLRPTASEKTEALARAITSILWQAGDYKEAVVAMRCERLMLDESATAGIMAVDKVLEYVKIKYFRSPDRLLEHIYNFIQAFIDDDGCVLFVYSLLLTHGIDRMKSEMDYPDIHLIGSTDEYASQELVNLILIGKASSNLFNGDMECNLEEENTSVRRGIPKRSKIGLLSLYDFLETCPVGSFYKDPEYPIWVIYSHGHFTVLFGTSRNIFKHPAQPFTLFYYDCYSRKNNEESFIIRPTARDTARDKSEPERALFRCIYTRWPLAIIGDEMGEEKSEVDMTEEKSEVDMTEEKSEVDSVEQN